MDNRPKKPCKWCKEVNPLHFPFQCRLNPKNLNRQPIQQRKPLPSPKKRIKQQSAKEKTYQTYKETVMRPALIARDGNACWCCQRPAYLDEKLDIEHTLTKGSRADLKRDIENCRLYCRWPCHRNKTDHIPCLH